MVLKVWKSLMNLRKVHACKPLSRISPFQKFVSFLDNTEDENQSFCGIQFIMR